MCLLKTLLLVLIIIAIKGYVNGEKDKHEYAGNKFPKKYLVAEDYVPTMTDLNLYLLGLQSTLRYLNNLSRVNVTSATSSIAAFFIRGILRRALRDDGLKVNKEQRNLIKHLIDISEDMLSHFVCVNTRYANVHGKDKEYRLSRVMTQNSGYLIMEALPDFNENRLQKWILNKSKMNNYLEEMDTAELPKEKYVRLVERSFKYDFLQVKQSDTCLSRVINNIESSPGQTELQPCRQDSYCKRNLHSSPSVAYGISHRMLNMLVYRFTRRCYWVSPEDDARLIDQLCAAMYRELVYIARRGYFARDLFLEHAALCSMMGYKEFYRRHWFHKALSWMGDEGCIQEFYNYELNRTKDLLSRVKDKRIEKEIRKSFKSFSCIDCSNHPMAVLTVFLSSAVRHALHFLSGR